MPQQIVARNQPRVYHVCGAGKIWGRAHWTLRENSHVQDRGNSSGEDALTARGVGSRRTCNPVLVSDLADTGQRPSGTGSEAGNGSLCLDDRSTQFIWGVLIPKISALSAPPAWHAVENLLLQAPIASGTRCLIGHCQGR